MAKVNNSHQKNLGMAVSAGVLLALFLAILLNNSKTFFGVYIPTVMAEQINSYLAVGLVVLAIALHRQRKSPTDMRVLRTLSWFLVFALVVIGLRFVALEMIYVPSWSNNGFTVSGGIMLLFAGLIAGWLVGWMSLRSRKLHLR